MQVITTDHPLHSQALELRARVLLEPIGYSIERFHGEYSGLEERFEQFVAVIDHPKGRRVIGTACLLAHYPERGVGKLMQMAVDPQRRGEGIGRELIANLERRAFGELGLRALFCHAQLSAVPFYEKMGWRVVGPEFSEAGIPHRRMEFSPGEDPAGPAA
ncbi:MAG: GNAT family N-acetyltransferase [Planctomycetota bacterium]|nr:GNAT family N-acetyltransferase [Planctomycetota bacterium]